MAKKITGYLKLQVAAGSATLTTINMTGGAHLSLTSSVPASIGRTRWDRW